LSLDRCQLANPGDRASRRGPGPRYWMDQPQKNTGRPQNNTEEH
jgi:hypothetical protein